MDDPDDARERADALAAVRSLRSVKRFDGAAARAREALASSPDDAGLMVELALCLAAGGDGAGALDVACRAVAVAPDLAGAHACLAEVHRLAWRPDQAIDAYNRAIELDPGDADVFVGRADALLDVVDAVIRHSDRRTAAPWLRAAERDAEHALRLNPRHHLAHVERARAMLLDGRPMAARESTAQALSIAPMSADAHRFHAAALQGIGDLRGASASLATAVRLDPSSTLPVTALESMRPRGAVPLAVAFGVLFVSYQAAASFHADAAITASLAIPLLAVGAASTVLRRRFRRRLDPGAVAALDHLAAERSVVTVGGLPRRGR